MELNVYEQHNSYRREAEMQHITPSHSAVAAHEGISGILQGSLKARGSGRVPMAVGHSSCYCYQILTLSLTSNRWGHLVTLNNLLKSSLNIFKLFRFTCHSQLVIVTRPEQNTIVLV